jgi:hypothetical protein
MSSSEIVKWIERWVDSASERSYQAAFVTALMHAGYRVIHNTSHTSLELGKDVIAESPQGKLVAFQLKGNPGSKLTISQWQDIFPQIRQLVGMPVPSALSAKKGRRHESILVTNGEVDEDVLAAIGVFNEAEEHSQPGGKLVVWTRGTVVSLIAAAVATSWPRSLETQKYLLSLLIADPENSIQPEQIQEICQDILQWDELKRPAAARMIERCIACWAVASLIAGRYLGYGNYYEAIRVFVITYGILAGFAERRQLSSPQSGRVLRSFREVVVSTAFKFSARLSAAGKHDQRFNLNPLTEFAIAPARAILTKGLVATVALERGGHVSDAMRDFIRGPLPNHFLVSEVCVPAFLACFWAKDAYEADLQADGQLISVLRGAIKLSEAGELYSSYYSLEEVIRHRFRQYLGVQFTSLSLYSAKRLSQFIRPLTLLLVRRNWKQHVKAAWPDVTHIAQVETWISDPSEFGLPRATSATEKNRFPEIPMTWSGLVDCAKNDAVPALPQLLRDDPLMVLLIVQMLPYRATEAVILWLDRRLSGGTWY